MAPQEDYPNSAFLKADFRLKAFCLRDGCAVSHQSPKAKNGTKNPGIEYGAFRFLTGMLHSQ